MFGEKQDKLEENEQSNPIIPAEPSKLDQETKVSEERLREKVEVTPC